MTWSNHFRAATAGWVAAVLLVGCRGPSPPAGERAERAAPAVLVIGLDGADWEILHRLGAEGRIPNLSRLEREGASGVLLAEEPLLSPVIWTTIATGRPPTEHGIFGFLTSRDGVTEPVRSDERKVRAFWNVAGDFGLDVGVIGWYATWPAEPVRGYLVSDRVGSHQVAGTTAGVSTGLAWPESIVPEIEALRAEVEREVDDGAVEAFLGPGEPVPVPEEKREAFLGILRTTELYRRLTPILTERFEPAISAVYFEGTDAVGHLFAEFDPPALPGIDPALARRLAGTFDRYYEHVDGIVGELVSRIDPEATTVLIVSDHGFKTGPRRPRTPSVSVYGNQAPIWHRPEGIFLLWGRGIVPGAELGDLTAYDVLPTVFRIAGLPLATNLRGRPADRAFTPELLAGTVRTVEDYEAAGPRETADGGDAPADEQMAKLRALGYVGGGAGDDGGQEGVLLNRYSEAVVLSRSGRRDEALRALRDLQRDAPDFPLGFLGEGLLRLGEGDARSAIVLLEKAAAIDPRIRVTYADRLGEAQVRVGREDEGIRTLRSALERNPSNGRASLVLAQTLLARDDREGAARYFEAARDLADDPATRAGGAAGLGLLAEFEERFEEASRHYDEALDLDPAFAPALERGAEVDLRLGRAERAVERAERLLEASPPSASTLAVLGRALVAVGRRDAARDALERSLALDPGQTGVRRLLDELGPS